LFVLRLMLPPPPIIDFMPHFGTFPTRMSAARAAWPTIGKGSQPLYLPELSLRQHRPWTKVVKYCGKRLF
jgi:hypothetical protein